jgi:hypothetical protein
MRRSRGSAGGSGVQDDLSNLSGGGEVTEKGLVCLRSNGGMRSRHCVERLVEKVDLGEELGQRRGDEGWARCER